MVDVIGQTFRGCTVDLDGKRFIRCAFFDCILRWRGLEEFDLDHARGVDLFDSAFRFEGAAAPAIEGFLFAFWRTAKPVHERSEER